MQDRFEDSQRIYLESSINTAKSCLHRHSSTLDCHEKALTDVYIDIFIERPQFGLLELSVFGARLESPLQRAPLLLES